MFKGRINDEENDIKLDVKDKKILDCLAQDSRKTTAEIAKKIQLSRDAVAYRIKRLENEGVILGYVPVLNLDAFGYKQFHVFFLLDEKVKSEHEQFINHLVNHPNTRAVMSYTDTWDVEWTIFAKSLEEFDKITTELFTKFPHVILERERQAVIRKYLSSTLPGHPAQRPIKMPETNGIKLDEHDKKLLQELAINSRRSSYELSQKIKLSPDAVLYRLKNLMKKGIILQFTTLFNLSAFKNSWYSYVINFEKFDSHDEAKLAAFATKHPNIVRAVKLYGSWDVMLAIVADTPKSYHLIVKEVKNEFAKIIHKYETWLAHEEYCYVPIPKVILAASE